MGQMLETRRRMIRSRGHLMTLRKLVPNSQPIDVQLMGFARAYRPEEIQGAVKQGDQRVEILNDELEAAGFGAPAHPQKLIDGGTMTLGGAWPVREGAAVIGWSLWVTG
jgi:hypothetical protein